MAEGRGQLGIFLFFIFGAVALVVLSITILLGISFVGGFVDGIGNGGPIDKTATPDPIVDQSVSFEDTSGANEISQVYQVKDSTGNAVELTGASDSYVSSNAQYTIAEDSNWTVGTWANVDSSAANENMTALSADGRVLIQYNGSRSEWSVWYYAEGSRDSYRVNISAPNQPGNYTWVEANHNGTHLQVFANTTGGEIANTSKSNIQSANTNTTNWDGSLDETRTFDDSLNSSQRSDLVSNPIEPRKGTNRTSRVMYDQRSGSEYPVYFTGTTVTAHNFTRVSGLPGNELTEGVDYTLNTDGGTITALANGRIDGAPVVWIDYEYLDGVSNNGRTILDAFNLFSNSILIIPAVATLVVLLGLVLGVMNLTSPTIPGSKGNR